jgi:hypothetical protein
MSIMQPKLIDGVSILQFANHSLDDSEFKAMILVKKEDSRLF